MTLFSYVVRDDAGFAPNPEKEYCTLACCKPIIRRTAKKGDWVVGTGSVKHNAQKKIIYAMKITEEPIDFEKYGRDERFKNRIDNIYLKDGNTNGYKQKPNRFHGGEEKKRDLSGAFILISNSNNFSYFGMNAKELDPGFEKMIKKGPGHKCKFDPDLVNSFVEWAKRLPKGKQGEPFEKQKEQNKSGGCRA